MAQVTHQRIHRANDVTWCGLYITYKRAEPLTNVVTISEEAHSLLEIKFVNGKIDYTPKTFEQKQIIKAERARLEAETTCKRCRKSRGYDKRQYSE